MRILKLFKRHVLALVAIVVLLCVQAGSELSLPSYMNEIVDVGTQQGGIRSAEPDTIRAESLADLETLMDADDVARVEAAYAPADAEGIRAYRGSFADEKKGSELARALASSEAAAISRSQGAGASDSGASMPDASAPGDDGDALMEQRAIQYVRAEYEAQGRDLAQIQNDYLVQTAALMFGLCLVGLVCAVVVGVIASRTAAAIARDLRRDTFRQVMRFSPAEVNKISQASLITRCTNDIQQIQMAATLFMRMVLYAPIIGIVAVARVVQTSTGLEWTVGVAVIAVLAVVGVLMGLTMPKFRRMQKLVDRVNLVAREMLDGLMPIRAFGREAHELARFDEASRELMETQLFTNRAMALMMPLMMLVMNCVTVLIVWFGAQGVSAGVMQVGDMMAFMSYTMQIVMAFMILTMMAVMLPRAEVAAGRVEEVISYPISIADPAQPQQPAEGAPTGELVFRDVSFRYPDADEDAVSGISFSVCAGKTVALIGSTGSGKSTLVQLIPRLYDVSAGSVTLDGVDVRDWSLSELRARIGYVPQQGRLFTGTVESNIKFAGDSVSDADMHRAADIAQATDFIEGREGGFASDVSQGGSNVSGGQRQRLAIARALAKRPEVLVFDDSFSALDYKTDAALREALAREAGGVALVIVAQRIASIMHADEILVLDDGAVVGRGTHEELLRTCPEYLEIATSQLSASELGLAGYSPTRPGEGHPAQIDEGASKGGEL